MFLSLKTLYRKRTVIWPFYFYTIIRTLSSFISLLKDTSLVATITVHEIFQTAQAINAVKFQPLLLYIEAAFVYLIFSTVLTQIQGMLEKKLGKHLVDTRV